jgi:hypothetical protein
MSPDSTNPHGHGGNKEAANLLKKKEAANQILSIGKKFESMDDMEHIRGAACCLSTTTRLKKKKSEIGTLNNLWRLASSCSGSCS